MHSRKDSRREADENHLACGRYEKLHVDRKVISDTILWLESIYGEMHGTCGKCHEYLGIWMDY